MTKYIARLNGQIIGKRTTRDRTYTHAIICARYRYNDRYETLAVTQWCGRPDLAQKAADQSRKHWEVVEVVPVEII